MGMGVAGIIINDYYGSFPHSLRLAPVRCVFVVQRLGFKKSTASKVMDASSSRAPHQRHQKSDFRKKMPADQTHSYMLVKKICRILKGVHLPVLVFRYLVNILVAG